MVVTGRCSLECVHGDCDKGGCVCEEGWTGPRCNERACDPRCSLHGQCHNGTCLCVQGWNGRHCTIRMYLHFLFIVNSNFLNTNFYW